MIRKLLSKRGISLERLAALVEVQEAGSISRASNGDPVRQSLCSRQLKELSEFFETELTTRKGRGLTLTPAGARVADAARQAFLALGDVFYSCRNEPVRFTIGAGDSLIHWLLLEKMRPLQASMPDATFGLRNMRTIDILHGLQDISVDFGLIRTDVLTPNLASLPLGRIEYALFIPKSLMPYQASRGQPIKNRIQTQIKPSKGNDCLWALTNCPLAGLHGKGEFNRRLAATASTKGINLRFSLECDSFPSLSRAVASGGYAAVLPVLARSELPADGILEIQDPMFACESRPICLAWNPRLARLRTGCTQMIEKLSQIINFTTRPEG